MLTNNFDRWKYLNKVDFWWPSITASGLLGRPWPPEKTKTLKHSIKVYIGCFKHCTGTSMFSPAHFAIFLLLYSSLRKVGSMVEVTWGGSFTHVWSHVSLLLTTLVTEKQSPWPFWLLKLSKFVGGRRVVSIEHTCMWIGVDDGVSWREWLRRFILENWARATATRPTLFLTFVICKKREKNKILKQMMIDPLTAKIKMIL